MSKILHTTKFIRKLKIGDWRWLSPPIQRTHYDILLQRNWRTRSLCTITDDRGNTSNYLKPMAVKDYKSSNVHELLNRIGEKIKYTGHILRSDVEEILNSVIKNETLTHMQALLLLRICNYFTFYESLKTRTTLCNNVWSTIKALEVQLDINCYNALLLVYLENNIDFSPNDILSEIKESNIKPNFLTYQRLIEQYCKKGDIVGTTKILEMMNREDIPINEMIFNSLIQGHSLSGNDSNAVNILNIMTNAGINPTSATYNQILCLHAKNGNIDDIKTVFEECKGKKIYFMDKDILDVIYTLSINDHSQYIEELMKYLVKNLSYNKIANKYIQLLIENKNVDTAILLYKTLLQEKNNYSNYSTLFTRKLVISDLATDELTKYCGILRKEKIDIRAFENAVYFCYLNDKLHYVIPLLEDLNDLGGDIREHYFFPYMALNTKKNNLHGTLDLLRIMFCNFNIKPSIKTLINFVIPSIMEPPEKIIAILEGSNVSFTRSANAVLFHLLQENKLEKASSFISRTAHVYKPKQIIDNLTNALKATKDVKSFMKIVEYNYNSLKNEYEKFGEDFPREMNSETFIRLQINDIVHKISNVHGHIAMKEILGYMCKQNLKLNEETANQIRNYLGQYVDQTTTFFLQKLIADSREESNITFDENQTDAINSNEQFSLIRNSIMNEDTKTVKQLIQKLEDEQTDIPPAFIEYIINYFAKIGDTKEVAKWVEIIAKHEDSYRMDSDTIMHCVIMHIRNKNLDDASEALKYPCVKKSKHLGNECMNVFDILCFQYPDKVMEVFKTYINFEGMQITNENLASFLIKKLISLNKKDYALEIYKYMSENHKTILQKFTLYKYFIDHEDAESLQQVTDAAVSISGERKSLYELAVAFSECNRIQQAKKIFMIDGIINRQQIEQSAEHYFKKKEDQNLENLCMSLNGLYEEVDDIFFKLIKLYEQNKQFDKCRNLWIKLQDDSNTTSFFLLSKLEQRLNKSFLHGKPTNRIEEQHTQFKTEQMYDKLNIITKYLDTDNIKEAVQQINIILDERQKLKYQNSFQDIITVTILKLLKADDLSTSIQLTDKLKNTNSRYLKAVRTLNEYYYNSNKYNDFLINLNKIYVENKDFKFDNIFYTNTAVRAMLDNEDVTETVKSFVNITDNKDDLHGPINAVWLKGFIEENPEADNIWNTHLKNSVFHAFAAADLLKDLNRLEKFPELCEKVMENTSLHIGFKNRFLSQICTVILKSENPEKFGLIYNCLLHGVKLIKYDDLNQKILSALNENLKDGLSVESLREESERLNQMAI